MPGMRLPLSHLPCGTCKIKQTRRMEPYLDAWWTDLTTLNQIFYVVGIFFSAFFVWQLLVVLLGLGDGSDAGVSGDTNLGEAGPELNDGLENGTVASFKLLTVRSLIAFGMLFGWAGALYLEKGLDIQTALLYALVWGSAGMAVVAYFFRGIRQLTETGNASLDTCVGTSGEVYLDIPEGGTGQVRVMESGAVAYVSARGRNGMSISTNTPVRILRVLDPTTLEVEPLVS